MLDNLKLIAERDTSDTLGVAAKQLSQLSASFDINFALTEPITSVVFAGMGGSSLYAEMLKTYPGLNIPYEVVKNYSLPKYVDEHTLCVISSFSGNTEETLSALKDAQAKGAQIAIIAGGGKLAEAAELNNLPFARLDSTIPQPRMAAFNGFKALAAILEAAGLVSGLTNELEAAAIKLEDVPKLWKEDVHTKDNLAKQLANELMGRSVVVYAGPLFAPVAYKWKISFNENAKNVAWAGYYSEFNHNEFIGWSSHPIDKPYGIVNLTSTFEHPRIQKRFEVSQRMLSGKWPHPHTIELKGDTVLEQLLWGIILGDFVALYVALLNGLDPAPVALIEKFKKELG